MPWPQLRLGAPDCPPWPSICFTASWTFAWICCPQPPTTCSKTGRTTQVFATQGWGVAQGSSISWVAKGIWAFRMHAVKCVTAKLHGRFGRPLWDSVEIAQSPRREPACFVFKTPWNASAFCSERAFRHAHVLFLTRVKNSTGGHTPIVLLRESVQCLGVPNTFNFQKITSPICRKVHPSLAWPSLQSLAVKKNFFLCKFWAVKNF